MHMMSDNRSLMEEIMDWYDLATYRSLFLDGELHYFNSSEVRSAVGFYWLSSIIVGCFQRSMVWVLHTVQNRTHYHLVDSQVLPLNLISDTGLKNFLTKQYFQAEEGLLYAT